MAFFSVVVWRRCLLKSNLHTTLNKRNTFFLLFFYKNEKCNKNKKIECDFFSAKSGLP